MLVILNKTKKRFFFTFFHIVNEDVDEMKISESLTSYRNEFSANWHRYDTFLES